MGIDDDVSTMLKILDNRLQKIESIVTYIKDNMQTK